MLGAVLFGAGPDDTHSWDDGYHSPVGGGITIGATHRYAVRFWNSRCYYYDGDVSPYRWFTDIFIYFADHTLEWWLENTNP